jgi:Ras-related protein Rab-6A
MITTARTKWCLVTIGDYAVGKTSLIKVITDSTFSPQEVTTIGMDPFQTTLYHDDKPVELVIWDTAGQERFKSLIPVYSRRSDAALVCFDMTSVESFNGVEEKVETFLRISESHKLVFLVATKMDLKDQFQVKESDARRWAEVHDIPLFFTSALTGDGIDDLKKKLAKRLAEAVSEEFETMPMAPPLIARRLQGGCCS